MVQITAKLEEQQAREIERMLHLQVPLEWYVQGGTNDGEVVVESKELCDDGYCQTHRFKIESNGRVTHQIFSKHPDGWGVTSNEGEANYNPEITRSALKMLGEDVQIPLQKPIDYSKLTHDLWLESIQAIHIFYANSSKTFLPSLNDVENYLLNTDCNVTIKKTGTITYLEEDNKRGTFYTIFVSTKDNPDAGCELHLLQMDNGEYTVDKVTRIKNGFALKPFHLEGQEAQRLADTITKNPTVNSYICEHQICECTEEAHEFNDYTYPN